MNLQEALASPESYSRLDERNDTEFYATERLVYHLDSRARQTIRRAIGTLIIEESPRVLDLMASVDSHLPDEIRPAEMVGLGLNEEELRQNARLDRHVVHDLNRDPRLPFDDSSFDVVLNTVSVDYMTRPFHVFAEVARILAPGGVLIVTFSNRMFPQKAVRIWRESDELTRIYMIEHLFESVPDFLPTAIFSSRGKKRPDDDKYAHLGIPSDPVTMIYAETAGAPTSRPPRPCVPPEPDYCPPREVVEERKKHVRETLRCPFCEVDLRKFEIEPNPFCEWPDEFVYVCFNNDCPYLIGGWDVMTEQGNPGYTYRLMYNPTMNRCMPTPLPNGEAAKAQDITPRG